MIGFAQRDMWPELQRMWQECFGDGVDYTRFLFEKLLRPEHVLVHMGNHKQKTDEAETPLSMLCIEPFVMRGPDISAKGAYVYGVATDLSARGQGLSSELLGYLHKVLKSRGYAASVLVPATETLFGFYAKRGYRNYFDQQAVVVWGEDLLPAGLPCVLSPASLYRLEDLRSRMFGRDCQMLVEWSRDYLHYIGEECRYLGGETLLISGAGREGYAVCYPVGSRVIVKELAVPLQRMEDVLASLHARYRAAEYHLRLPADFSVTYPGNTLPFAMIRWYDKEKETGFGRAKGALPYIAHVLD